MISLSQSWNLISQKCSSTLLTLFQDINTHSIQSPPQPQTFFPRKKSSNKMVTQFIPSPKVKPIPGYSPERQRSLLIQIKTVERRKKQLLDELKTVDDNLNSLIRSRDRGEEMMSKSKELVDHPLSYQEKTNKALELVRRMNKQRREMERRRLYAQEKLLKGIEKSLEYAKQIDRADEIKKQERRKEINQKIERRRSIHLKSEVLNPKKQGRFITEGPSPYHTNQIKTIETRRYDKLRKLISDNKDIKTVNKTHQNSLSTYNYKYQRANPRQNKGKVQNPQQSYRFGIKLYH